MLTAWSTSSNKWYLINTNNDRWRTASTSRCRCLQTIKPQPLALQKERRILGAALILPLLPIALRRFRPSRATVAVVGHRPPCPLLAALLAHDSREDSNHIMRLGFEDVTPEAVPCNWKRTRRTPCPLAFLDSATLLVFFPMS